MSSSVPAARRSSVASTPRAGAGDGAPPPAAADDGPSAAAPSWAADGALHRTLFVYFVVSALLIAFELGFFVLIVVPQVRGPLGGMLAAIRRQLGLPPHTAGRSWVPRAGAAALGTMHDREQGYIEGANRVAVVAGALIAAVPALCAVGIVLASGPFRAGGRAAHRHAAAEIALTFALIAAFQGVFFFFGQRWAYTEEDEHVLHATEVYDHDGAAARNATERGPHLLEHGVDWSAHVEARLRTEALALAPLPPASALAGGVATAAAALAAAAGGPAPGALDADALRRRLGGVLAG